MRIACVISTLERCGPVNVLYGIVDGLIGQCDIAVYTLAPEGKATRKNEFERLNIRVNCVCDSRIDSLLRGTRKLARALEEFKPDVVHAHGYRACLLCSKLNYTRMATVHNCIYEDFLTSYGKYQAWWMTRTEISALRRFDSIVACSDSNAEYLRREYGLCVGSIRNGVDQRVFFPLGPGERLAMRRSLGYGHNKTILISTGGCSERKGTFSLIESFHAANQDGSAELHVFGKGPDYDSCVGLGYGDVFLHGFVDDVVPYLQAADLFVSASMSEGMPLAVLEALSCGCGALLSDIPPHREIADVVQGLKCVVIFDSLDAEAIRGALATKKWESRALPNSKIFGSMEMSQRYYQAYLDVLGNREASC